jgi:hypothetical protein
MVSIIDFIGTSFFISLGITFILLLLLTIHFQKRLSTIESKEDKLFEIMNNMVKEMKHMKHVTNVLMSENEKLLHEDNIKSIDVSRSLQTINIVDDNSYSSDCSDDESDDESDDDEEYKILVSDDENDELDSCLKVIDLNHRVEDITDSRIILLDVICEVESDETKFDKSILNDIDKSEVDIDDDASVVDIDESEVDIDESEVDIDESEVDIDASEVDIDASEVDAIAIESINPDNEVPNIDILVEVVSNEVDYNKESTQSLKNMVTSKKLSSAPSKLKRIELLKLLGVNV